MVTAFLLSLLTPQALAIEIPLLASVAGVLFKLLVKDPAKQEKTKIVLDASLPIAIQAFKTVAASTPNKIDDAIAAGLESLTRSAETAGLSLSTDHKTAAVAAFKAAVQEGK